MSFLDDTLAGVNPNDEKLQAEFPAWWVWTTSDDVYHARWRIRVRLAGGTAGFHMERADGEQGPVPCPVYMTAASQAGIAERIRRAEGISWPDA